MAILGHIEARDLVPVMPGSVLGVFRHSIVMYQLELLIDYKCRWIIRLV